MQLTTYTSSKANTNMIRYFMWFLTCQWYLQGYFTAVGAVIRITWEPYHGINDGLPIPNEYGWISNMDENNHVFNTITNQVQSQA